MKKLLLPLFTFLAFSPSFAQIANGDFEDWTKLTMFEHPASTIPTFSSNYETYFIDGSLNVTSISGPSSRAMRVENTSFEGDVNPGFFIFGNVPSSEGENLVFQGGFPMTDAAVTGITMDLSYNFPGGSTGFLIVQFKSNDTPIGNGNFGDGTFHFPLAGSQDWTTSTFVFEGGLGATPEVCVIGIASANLLGSDLPFAAGSFVEVDNIAFTGTTTEVPGGNFNTWENVNPVFLPANSVVEVDGINDQFIRSLDAFEGAYALGLVSEIRDGQVNPGTLTLGDKIDGAIVPTIALMPEHAMLSFMYQYQGLNDDQALATVRFFSEDQGEFLEVFQKDFQLNSTDVYEALNYEFVEDLPNMVLPPTHITISFASSIGMGAEAGSTLLIDNVALSGALPIRSAFENPSQLTVRVYPNPTLGRVEIDFLTNRAGYYRVYNPSGIQIAIRTFSSTRKLVHDLSGQPAGKYVFRFYHNGGVETARVMKL